jgi:hypothetical protein
MYSHCSQRGRGQWSFCIDWPNGRKMASYLSDIFKITKKKKQYLIYHRYSHRLFSRKHQNRSIDKLYLHKIGVELTGPY